MDSPFLVFAGIDWAEEAHAVCAMVDGRALHHSFANTPQGIADMAQWLARLTPAPNELAVAIEVPHGPVVEGLLLRGFALHAINPKQLDRHRDRYSPSGAKDDRRDAFVLADSLRLDPSSFNAVALPPASLIELRALTRLRTRLVRSRVRLANQLRSTLLLCAPHYLSLSPAANDPWFWELLALLPSPGRASLAKPRLARLLKRFRISRLSADEILPILRTPPLLLTPGTFEACAFSISTVLPQLSLAVNQLARTEGRIDDLLVQLLEPLQDAPSDAQIIDSYPGAGVVVVAGLLSEAHQLIADRNLSGLRAQAGTAPVTKRSGKTWNVHLRRAVNPYLRDILYYLADAAMKNDDWARAYYRQARARGQSHPRALRGLGDRILSQLMAMLQQRQCFDPDRRQRPVSPGLPAA